MIDKYLSKIRENFVKDNKEIDWDEQDEPLDKLYDHCSNKKYIFDDIKNGKRITTTDTGFDLAFLKEPTIRYKGTYIKLIDNTNIDREIGSEVFNGPVLLFLEEALLEIKKITKKHINDEDIDVCVRELLSNALIHKDYDSYTPIIIKIYTTYIEISNPCKVDLISLKHLNTYDMPTNLVNGCLAEIAFEMHLMEGQGRGEETLRKIYKKFNKSNYKPYDLVTNILRVTIPLR